MNNQVNIATENYNFAGIYQFLNVQNGKRYIGQSQNIKRRYNQHKNDSVSRNLGNFYRAVRKYGFDLFEFTVLEIVEDLSLLDSREEYWIEHFQSYRKELGYNLCREARTIRGIKRTAETRQRISQALKGRKFSPATIQLFKERPFSDERRKQMSLTTKQFLQNNPNPFLGKTHSEETKKKISEANSGQKMSQEFKEQCRARLLANHVGTPKKKVSQINRQTNEVITTWNSLCEASRETSIQRACIWAACTGKQKSAGGFVWVWA